MAATLRIDTLRFAKRLTEAGLPREAAEAIVEGLNEAELSEAATRTDIERVETEIGALRSEIGGIRSDLKSEIAGVKAAITDLRAEIYGRLWVTGSSG